MRLLIIPLIAILAGACTQSPTSPTPVPEEPPPTTPAPEPEPPPTDPPPAPQYRWDLIGAGCPATEAPSPVPDIADAVLTPRDDGGMHATWGGYETSDGRSVLLTVVFALEDNEYRLCSWETSDLLVPGNSR